MKFIGIELKLLVETLDINYRMACETNSTHKNTLMLSIRCYTNFCIRIANIIIISITFRKLAKFVNFSIAVIKFDYEKPLCN